MNTAYPLSQRSSSPNGTNQRVFVDGAGNPLPIFVDSNGIRDNRPRLVRSLRDRGAQIIADVSRARIIIVDPNSNEGRQFVLEWGKDPGKVVLPVMWIHKCLEAGRALLENDMWGGCGNLDTTPLGNGVENDDELGLFTHSQAYGLNGGQSSQLQNPTNSGPSSHRRSSMLPTLHPTAMETAMEYNISNPLSQISRDPAPPSSQSQTTIAPAQVPPLFPMQNQLLQQFPQNALLHGPNMTPSMVPFGQVAPQAPQYNMNNMNPQMSQAFNSEVMSAALSVIQGFVNGQLMPSMWQGQTQQPFMQLPSQGYPTLQPLPSQPQDSVSSVTMNGYQKGATDTTREVSPSVKNERQVSHRSSSPLPTFTTVDDSDSDSSPPPQSILQQKGKRRHRESPRPTSPKFTKRSGSPLGSLNKKRYKKRSSFTVEHATSQGSPPSRDLPQPAGIFTHEGGMPMTFFLQVQMRNRQNVIKQIKANGGKIETDPANADFILLDAQSSKDRDQWMRTVKGLGRFALGPGYVEACISQKGLVEEEAFVIEAKKARRKKRANSSKPEERESTAAEEVIGYESVSRSPSPPPFSQIEFNGGRNNFEPGEIDFALRLAKYFIRRDNKIGMQQLGAELARKAPRHPAASWTTLLYRDQLRAELQDYRDARSQVSMKHKRSPANVLSGSEPEVEAQLTRPIETTSAQGSLKAEAARPNGSNNGIGSSLLSQPLEDDLRTIVDFFTHPPEGIREDGALWATLASRHTCRTAPSWQAFYAANEEAVNNRVLEIAQLQQQISPGDNMASQ